MNNVCSHVKLPKHRPCELCKFKNCKDRRKRPISCANLKRTSEAMDMLRAEAEAAVEGVLEKFPNLRRENLKITGGRSHDFAIWFAPLSDEARFINSKDRKCVAVKGSSFDVEKNCEQCGASFLTVNEDRRLCDECWAAICEGLGVNYSQITAWNWSNRKRTKARDTQRGKNRAKARAAKAKGKVVKK